MCFEENYRAVSSKVNERAARVRMSCHGSHSRFLYWPASVVQYLLQRTVFHTAIGSSQRETEMEWAEKKTVEKK